ncbi:hypothetical protein [uncultured Shewanella sp.]|uniref:hypothetical protein n=1 Tax=Shewanella atlantica TaxID=271099 RepID=UPI00262A7970|nr:hypothetical protein [uncultured Shewanella sp.]
MTAIAAWLKQSRFVVAQMHFTDYLYCVEGVPASDNVLMIGGIGTRIKRVQRI